LKELFKDRPETRDLQQGYSTLLVIPKHCEKRLEGVLADTLAHPGSLTRAKLAYKVLHKNFETRDAALPMSIAIEYFHTASLLLDDLPCMDDAYTRRGQTCPHRIYGEAACILGALAFINRAYALVWQAMAGLPQTRSKPAAALLEHCLGAAGVINGQSMDVHFREGQKDEESVAAIARGKTVTLIRLTLVVPALMVGASAQEVALLDKLSLHWGSAYQLLDDFKDVLGDVTSAKTSGRDFELQRPNMVLCVGLNTSWQRLDTHFSKCEAVLTSLAELPRDWSFLTALQQHLLDERTRLQSLSQAA